MLKYEVELFADNKNNCPVELFLQGMPKKARPKISTRISLLQEKGYDMPSGYCKKLKGHPGLLELIYKYRTNAYRIFYFFSGNKIILLHAFLKKTEKTPNREIELAEKRMVECKEKRI